MPKSTVSKLLTQKLPPNEAVVIPLARDTFEIARKCDLSCAASHRFSDGASSPCQWRKWTGDRWECSLIEHLSPQERMAFAGMLLSEWLCEHNCATTRTAAPTVVAAD
jgi:hypothetical protein